MNNDEQKRFKATNPKVSDVQAFKQILERALTPHATNSLDRFNELKAFVQGPGYKAKWLSDHNESFTGNKTCKARSRNRKDL